MRYATDNEETLYRTDEENYEMLCIGNEWLPNGDAFGVFTGFESGKVITEKEAERMLHKQGVKDVSTVLKKKGLDVEDAIKYLMEKLNVDRKRAIRMLS